MISADQLAAWRQAVDEFKASDRSGELTIYEARQAIVYCDILLQEAMIARAETQEG